MPLNQADIESSRFFHFGGALDPRIPPNGLDAPRGAVYALGGKTPATLRKVSEIGGDPCAWDDVSSVEQLSDMKSAALLASYQYEEAPTRAEFNELATMLLKLIDEKFSKSDLQPLLTAIDNRVEKEQFQALISDYNRRVIETMPMNEVIQILNLVSNKITKLRAASISISEKLDAEALAASDYESSTETLLSGI